MTVAHINPVKNVLVAAMVTFSVAMALAWVPAAAQLSTPIQPLVQNAQLIGSGTLRVFGFRVYQAKLFSQPQFDKNQWPQYAFALELQYLRSVRGERIASTSDDELRRLNLGTAAARERWSNQMKTLFVDVKDGDKLIGVYQPNGASLFFLNDKPLGKVEDPEFGVAFFSIWFSANSKDTTLRDSLLNGQR
jgi:Chalcone isomerase-like